MLLDCGILQVTGNLSGKGKKWCSAMSERQKNLIDYIVVCVNEFAKAKKMTNPEALAFLHEYKALDFLEEEYDIEHTFSIEDTIEHMELVCRRNGGIVA